MSTKANNCPNKRTVIDSISPFLRTDKADIRYNSKMLLYPDGSYDLVVSTSADFGPGGWELHRKEKKQLLWALVWTDQGYGVRKIERHKERQSSDPEGEDLERSMRRARSKVRRYALANDFKWFVTLTLDASVIGDRCDPVNVVKKLNVWLSNMVQRQGLRYVLVPERHKKGGIHFHGFFNDCPALRPVDSGHKDKKGHTIYNLARWSMGFSTAIELYGDYHSAVAYVCKYIGKDSEKIGGRWYYSGGELHGPVEKYADLDFRDVLQTYQDRVFQVEVPGKTVLVVNGIRPECAQTVHECG